MPRLYWAKDWAKLLMNATLLAADCLPRGGVVTVEAGADAAAPSFHIRAQGLNARVTEEVDQALKGEAPNVDARHVQPFLTYKLSRTVERRSDHHADGRRRRTDGRLEPLTRCYR